MSKDKGEIKIFKEKGKTALEVRLVNETVWLTQKQMGELFEKDYKTISEHIRNLFKEKELDKKATVWKFQTVQIEGKREVKRSLEHYNLDVIISVGYRVKSKRGTEFRKWANRVLKDYLIEGYVMNQKRLEKENEKLRNLQSAVGLLENILDKKPLIISEATGLLKVVSEYKYGLETLDKFDHRSLTLDETTVKESWLIDYKRAIQSIQDLKVKFKESTNFGVEKDKFFESSISTIYQSFDGEDLYPSIEEKAAHLLYFIVKNHSFVDGNKRIAASIFLWFLQENGILYRDGEKRIADNALVALTLMIAESRPDEKDIMVKVIVNLINKKN